MTTNENGTIQECCCGGCCGAHTECDCGEHIAVDPCLPVENTKTKVVQHADNVEQACRVCHADNVGTLYEGIQSLEAGDYIRIDGTNRISVTLTAGDGIAIDEDTGKISSTMRSLEAGRLTKITQDGKVSSTLQAGKNVSIDEETGLISAESGLSGGDLTEISDDGKINCILEAGRLMEIDANRMACKVQGGDLIAIDESTGTVDCTLTAGRLMTLEGNIISSKVAAGTHISVDETTGTVSCSLTGGRLTEIDDSGRVNSTLQAGEHIDIADNTISATYKAGNGISIEGDNIKAPNGYGLQYSNNKLSLYVLSGKGIKNKSEGSQNLGGFAYMPELDIEGGQGITIGNNGNTVTISTATPLDRDIFFDQADKVARNWLSISELDKKNDNYGYGDALIIDMANALPDEYLIDFSDVKNNWIKTNPDGLLANYYEADMPLSSVIAFNGDLLVGEIYFDIDVKLINVPQKLIPYIDRVIVASSPLWLSYKGSALENANSTYAQIYLSGKANYGGFPHMRKATNIPEECLVMAYKGFYVEDARLNNPQTSPVRLNDRLMIEACTDTYSSFYFFQERGIYGNEIYVPDPKSGVYPELLMGKSAYQMSWKTPSGTSFYGMFGVIDVIKGPLHSSYKTGSVDAFFGCFPDYGVRSVFIGTDTEDGAFCLSFKMKRLNESFIGKKCYIPTPKIRVMFPKNEIIRKVQAALANGEMDEYGNPLTT